MEEEGLFGFILGSDKVIEILDRELTGVANRATRFWLKRASLLADRLPPSKRSLAQGRILVAVEHRDGTIVGESFEAFWVFSGVVITLARIRYRKMKKAKAS